MHKIDELLDIIISKVLNPHVKMKLKKILWMVVCNVYVIQNVNEFKMVEPAINCSFIRVTLDNCHRVVDFREENRITDYRNKLTRKEIGYFAEHNGKMIGSVWATINKTDIPLIVQTTKKLMYNEGLVHDNVVSENFRGLRIGPFMESSMFSVLFSEYGLSKIIADVNVRNRASLQMFPKLGLRVNRKVLYVMVFDKLILKPVLRKYH